MEKEELERLADSDQSRIHRFMVGDRVAHVVAGEQPREGVIVSFENPEKTYLGVQFDDAEELEGEDGEYVEGGVAVLTEDELRRVG